MKTLKLPYLNDSKIKIFIYILTLFATFFWISFNLEIIKIEKTTFGLIFGSLIVLSAILGSFYSFFRSHSWGFYKSSMGQSLIFLGFGLLMWSIGQTLFLFDSFLENPLNLYDFFFILIDPFYLIGIYFISKSIGTFKNFLTNINLIILPFLIFILNLLVISILKNEDPLFAFTNMDINSIFIAGSVILATLVITIILFSKKLGGIYKSGLNLILIGILLQYVGDNLFEIYSSQQENGSLADLLFFLSIIIVSFGIHSLNPNKLNEKRN